MEGSVTQDIGSRQFCSECGQPYPSQDLVHFGAAAVCANCKPNYVQRMREGVVSSNAAGPLYGGFWRRFVAVAVDAILLWLVLLPVSRGFSLIGGRHNPELYPMNPLNTPFFSFWRWTTLVTLALEISYYVFFLSHGGATIGKMLMGVKVVTATGEPVSVARAFGRFFARYLSAFTLLIGYIMAAFDDQKRALHDHICNTRVIRT